jgi:uncharacterized membrane protein
MTQEKFLGQLKRSLSGLPAEEKRDILYDYEEHFRIGREEGKSEEQIADSLGNPRILGRSFRIESLLEESKKGNRAANVLRAVFASLSLGFFNVIITVPVYAGLVAALVSLWAGAVSLAVTGVAVILAVILQPLLPAFINLGGMSIPFLIFASIGISALGLLSLIGMWRLSQWFLMITGKYVTFNLRIIKKQEARK